MTGFHLTGADWDEVHPLVEAHHYSGRMPSAVCHCYAVRESGGLFGDFGAVVAASIFRIPPTRWAEPVIELSRLVKVPDYSGPPLSALIAFSCQHLKRNGWSLVVSFADWTHGHHGGVYQAANWNYSGQRSRSIDGVIVDGVFMPGRTCNGVFGTRSPERLRSLLPDKSVEPSFDEGKHLYWKALTVAGKTKAKRLKLRSLAYPKPNATCPVDERVPPRLSKVQPLEVAP